MKLRNYLFTITFVILIFIFPLSFYVLSEVAFAGGEVIDIQTGEKREKTEFNTDDSIDNLGKNIEAYYNDRIPYRNFLIMADRSTNGFINNFNKKISVPEESILSDGPEIEPFIDNYPFLCSANNAVIFGQSNWFFYNIPRIMEIYKKEEVLDDFYLQKISNEINEIKKIAKEKGVEIYFLIAPDKQEVYEEYMPKVETKNNLLNLPERLVKYVKENTGVDIIYPRDLLKSYKDKYRMYKKYDSHWNRISAYLATNEIYKQMGTSLPDLSKINIKKIDECVSSVFGDLPAEGRDLIFLSNVNYEDYPPSFEYDVQYKGGNEAINPSKSLCLIGDSFCIDMDRVVLSKDFVGHSFVHGVDQLPKGELINVISASDIIIYELVERNIADNFLVNLQNIKLALINK